jgi:hypothetical protein
MRGQGTNGIVMAVVLDDVSHIAQAYTLGLRRPYVIQPVEAIKQRPTQARVVVEQ